MNGKELMDRLKQDRKWITLGLLFLCGAVLIALSFLLGGESGKTESRGADVSYADTEVEQRLSRVLSQISGAGQVDVLVLEKEDDISGVLIVADGADQLPVRTELMRAAMTALDIPADSVEVFARNDGGEE